MTSGEIYPRSLDNNGAIQVDRWRPEVSSRRQGDFPEEGDLIALRYAAWRVLSSRMLDPWDISAADQAVMDRLLNGYNEERQTRLRPRITPRIVVVVHELGPNLYQPQDFAKDGTLHLGSKASWDCPWHMLSEPFRVCSCHGHPWPCQEIDQAELTAWQMSKMDKLMATAVPGICAHCLEPITARQRSVTFPEPSLLVPGAPGPTFHAGKAECWLGAEAYERRGRLRDDPMATRVASCPGMRFIHDGRNTGGVDRLDCSAGQHCTGLHGPAGLNRDIACWTRTAVGADAFTVHPTRDCGYRDGHGDCLGSEPQDTFNSMYAADISWTHLNAHLI